MLPTIDIYVYGSCHFSQRTDNDEAVGNGGYGVIIVKENNETTHFSAGNSLTTNARMEIMAITAALESIEQPACITLYSPNGYIIDTLTKGWLESWKQINYKKKKHADLWKLLDNVLQLKKHEINFRHYKTLQNKIYTNKAERLAKEMSARNDLPNDLSAELKEQTIDMFDRVSSEEINSEPDMDSICVDASTIDNPGITEYRGVDTKTGKVLFEMKYKEATNNIGEFLAIVHALALFKKQGKELKIIYSDSMNAITWVQQKKCKTKFVPSDPNSKVPEHIERAITWLQTNEYDTRILKWNTDRWGEIPADYGRK